MVYNVCYQPYTNFRKKLNYEPKKIAFSSLQVKAKMGLLSEVINQQENILHKDGVVNYYEKVLSLNLADSYLSSLQNKIEWKNDEVFIFGKQIITKRKVAWYADKPFKYTYSNNTKLALPWTDELLELKEIVEKRTSESFNSCLLNLYHDGNEGMAWHSDAERELKKNGAIGSLSLGAERRFSLKHKKTKDVVSFILHHGSLLVMNSTTQSHWLHCLPQTKTVNKPRVNLTFRTVVYEY